MQCHYSKKIVLNAEILKATQLKINQSCIELASRDSLLTIRTKNSSRDLILTAPRVNSLISITLCTCSHAILKSQTSIYPNHNTTPKKLKFGARNPNPFRMVVDRPKGRAVGGHTKRVGYLDSSLYLTPYSIITELTRGEVRVASPHALLIKQSYLMSTIMFLAFFPNFMLFPFISSHHACYLFLQFMPFDTLSKISLNDIKTRLQYDVHAERDHCSRPWFNQSHVQLHALK